MGYKCMTYYFLQAFIILSSCLSVKAQDVSYPYDYPLYNFVQYDKNKLVFHDNDTAFNQLFAKLDTLIFSGTGHINILHIGASHVQADQLTGRFRERLYNFVPGLVSNRGLIFPYGMARSNHPFNYYSTYTGKWTTCRIVEISKVCNFGVSGITAITTDSLAEVAFSFKRHIYPVFRFNEVTVLHATGPSFSQIDLLAGDSINCTRINGEGYTIFRTDKMLDTLKFRITKTDTLQTSFELYGFLAGVQESSGITYHSSGINGAHVGSYLRCNLLAEHLSHIQPDLIILSLGINDVQGKEFSQEAYERNYDTLISRIRSVVPNASVVITSNSDSYFKRKYPNKHSVQARDAAYNLASKHPNTVLWDWFDIMGGLGSVKTWEAHNLVKKDLVHFTQEGYKLTGDLFFGAFIKAFDSYLKQQKGEEE